MPGHNNNQRTSDRLTKRDYIVAELRTLIASGALPRGSRVQQDDLAARFQTSITPVREAIRQLEAEGILVGESHRGVRVSETNVDDQRGIYVARRLLEPFAAQLATLRVSRRDCARASDLVDALDQAGERGDLVGVREANRDFHFLIYEKSEIPSLVSVIEHLWLSFPWDILEVIEPRASRSVKEHRSIVARMREGDSTAVRGAVERHIRSGYRALVKHLTGKPPPDDPFDEIEEESS